MKAKRYNTELSTFGLRWKRGDSFDNLDKANLYILEKLRAYDGVYGRIYDTITNETLWIDAPRWVHVEAKSVNPARYPRPSLSARFFVAIFYRLIILPLSFVIGVSSYIIGTTLLTQFRGFGFSQMTMFIVGALSLFLVGLGFLISIVTHTFKEIETPLDKNLAALKKLSLLRFIILKISRIMIVAIISITMSLLLFRVFPTHVNLPNVTTVFLGVFGTLAAIISLWLSWKR